MKSVRQPIVSSSFWFLLLSLARPAPRVPLVTVDTASNVSSCARMAFIRQVCPRCQASFCPKHIAIAGHDCQPKPAAPAPFIRGGGAKSEAARARAAAGAQAAGARAQAAKAAGTAGRAGGSGAAGAGGSGAALGRAGSAELVRTKSAAERAGRASLRTAITRCLLLRFHVANPFGLFPPHDSTHRCLMSMAHTAASCRSQPQPRTGPMRRRSVRRRPQRPRQRLRPPSLPGRSHTFSRRSSNRSAPTHHLTACLTVVLCHPRPALSNARASFRPAADGDRRGQPSQGGGAAGPVTRRWSCWPARASTHALHSCGVWSTCSPHAINTLVFCRPGGLQVERAMDLLFSGQ